MMVKSLELSRIGVRVLRLDDHGQGSWKTGDSPGKTVHLGTGSFVHCTYRHF
jgi:hypothetical protein